MSKHHELRYKITSIAITVTLAVLLLCLFWTLYPYKHLTFGELTVDKTSYMAGDFVVVTINDYCTNGISNSIERWLQNSSGAVMLPPIRFNGAGDAVCVDKLQFRVSIPVETPDGHFKLDFYTRYEPNPIRVVTVKTSTPIFQVTAKE